MSNKIIKRGHYSLKKFGVNFITVLATFEFPASHCTCVAFLGGASSLKQALRRHFS